jgi:hypothetical protein
MDAAPGIAGMTAGYPQELYAPAQAGALAQGDLCPAFVHQLRTKKDAPGPGDEEHMADKVPHFGPYEDHELVFAASSDKPRNLVLRIWPCWTMVLLQGCELDYQDPDDSRVVVAPVAFETKWPGDHWGPIRTGSKAGYLYLPPLDRNTQGRVKARGWPVDTAAAVCLASATAVSHKVLSQAKFGLSQDMTMLAQQRLVDFFSIRNWPRTEHADVLEGKRVVGVRRTAEVFRGPGALFKLALAGDEDDEMSVGIVLQP